MASEAWLEALAAVGSASASYQNGNWDGLDDELLSYLSTLREYLDRRRGHWHRPPRRKPPPPPGSLAGLGSYYGTSDRRPPAPNVAPLPSSFSNPFDAFGDESESESESNASDGGGGDGDDDDDEQGGDVVVFHGSGGGGFGGVGGRQRPPMDMRRLLIRTLTCLSEVRSARGVRLVSSRDRQPPRWGDAAAAYAESYGYVADALGIADRRCAELLERKEGVGRRRGGGGRGGGADDGGEERGNLADDAQIVNVAASHFAACVDRYRNTAHRRMEFLRAKLEPQWTTRDDAKAKMGAERWENNPRPKGDYARLRAANEAELRDLEGGEVLVGSLNAAGAVDRSRRVIEIVRRDQNANGGDARKWQQQQQQQPFQTYSYAPLPDRTFGVELELSCSRGTSKDDVAAAIRGGTSTGGGVDVTVTVVDDYLHAHDPVRGWKLVHDGSIECSRLHPDCSKFELVSPVLRGQAGLEEVRSVLAALSTLRSMSVNKSMGFHVHVGVADLNLGGLVRVCQNAVTFEDAVDSFMPPSRRTGSAESNRFFKSSKWSLVANGRAGDAVTNNARHRALASCGTVVDLATLMNPNHDRYYKVNLQNLRTQRQSTVEFRQHSSTCNSDKVEAWVRFCLLLVQNSVQSRQARSLGATKTVEEAFEILFRSVVKDATLREFYARRRAELMADLGGADGGGGGCCYGCRSGGTCVRGGGSDGGMRQTNGHHGQQDHWTDR